MSTRAKPSLRYLAALAISALALFCGLAAYLRSLEASALRNPAINDQLTASGRARPLAAVSQALREMKLVTVSIDSTVTATTAHDSWRGDVAATVRAPVRLLYGADLSKLSSQSLAYSPLSRGYHIRIPAPERIATEVCGDAEDVEVQIGWLRFRSRAGEYYLGQARKDLYERARELTLSPEDAAFVRRATREQTEALVRKIVGGDAPVTVAYEDGAP
jgi:hypothetical protein